MIRTSATLHSIVLAAALLATPALAQTPPAPASAAAEAPWPPAETFEVVGTYSHDAGAFTQGLVYRDGVLFESTGRAPSTVRRVRLEDGVVLDSGSLDETYFGEGLTELNGRLFTLTWRSETGFIWNPDDLSAPIGQFTYPGEGWGLTTDGERLILSDGTPDIRFLDPVTFAETGRITVTFRGQPLPRLNELEWVDGQILANVWQQDAIVRIDPASGVVLGVIDLTGLLPADQRQDPEDDVLNGIAWDAAGRRLFVTGKDWPSLFEIRLIPAA